MHDTIHLLRARIGHLSMMVLNKLIMITSIFLILVIATQISKIVSQEVENEEEFSYEEGHAHGPGKWGFIHKEWEKCNNGENQSPIDLSDKKVVVHRVLGPMTKTYRPSIATMVNRGHDIMLSWEDGAGGFWINRTEYVLRQLHWHSPSEHTLNNKSYALELHMVHRSANGEIAVIGILYNIGRPDTFLYKVEKHIGAVQNKKNVKEFVGMVDPRDIKTKKKDYYRYLGSLTTPPCTEGVIWTILKEERTVSREQVNLLREAVMDGMEHNSRPKQNIHSRNVMYYGLQPTRSIES